MMKTIYLIRHAKSDWANELLHDLERPLNSRGYTAAHTMSQRLNLLPDLILSSPAVRAASTALIFARTLAYEADRILLRQELYESSVASYLRIIRQIDEPACNVLLFGHNPIITDTAAQLCRALPMEMPTCAIAGIRFRSQSWKTVSPGSGELVLFDYPKKGGEQAQD